jgi:hypothetical protein
MDTADIPDDVLFALLNEAVAPSDTQRARLHELGRNAWEWRNVDHSLAELLDDSLVVASDVRLFETNERAMSWEWESGSLELLAVANGETLDVQVMVAFDSPSDVAPTVSVSSVLNGEHYDHVEPVVHGVLRFTTAPGRLISIAVGGEGSTWSTGWFRI